MAKNEVPKYKNPDLPIEQRAEDLVGRMTLEEKVSQMLHNCPAIPRLDIPEYNWWNECLHGVARAGLATVFPQAIAMAASFDIDLISRVATAISDEARAKHHQAVRQGFRGKYFGLTFWTPNINIFRDPRWGRGHETYGEDPYLTSRIGTAFVKALQGDNPKYLKLVATPKHYAVHSGPENLRHSFNAQVSLHDLWETYLPAFEACVKDGKAASVMGAYNRTNGEPCCGSKTLLQEILRKKWGFDGYVVSDCWAICDFHKNHKITQTPPQSAAMAVRNGCDLNCGKTFPNLVKAIELGLITEKEIDTAVKRLFIARFRLGMFDPEDRVPYAKISADKVHCPAHRQLARQAARQSIVLLKNAGNLLPLDRNKIKSIAVIGPNAMNQKALLANYYGLSTNLITVVQGIVGAVSPGTQVTYDRGCELAGKGAVQTTSIGWTLENTDLILAVLGNSPEIEGEEAEEAASDGGGDRQNISLPGRQEELLRYLHNTGKPVVLVLMGGGAIEINWAQENIPAILTAWYPGEEGGSAIADVLFGDYNPAGRLPVTFYKSLAQLPEFTDYNMKGRTYRYMTEEPLYPFGYGLSYTTFTYKNLRLNKEQINIGQGITASVDVTNTGRCSGNEIVQLYTNCRNVAPEGPLCQLRGFQRISLKPQETKTITFELAANQLAIVDNNGQSVIKPGNIEIIVAGHSPISCPHLYGDENLLKKNLKIR